MAKKIKLEWPAIETTVVATMLDQEEPEWCKILWEKLKNPMKTYCSHTLSTGQIFIGFPRPTKHPEKVGSQRAPVGRKIILLSRLEPGMISYGGGGIRVCYGTATEPLPAGGPVVARVNEEYMRDLVRAGRFVWECQYTIHRPAIMVVSRLEE